MKNSSKLFIGNWKMFGIPRSIKILDKINDFFKKDNNNRKYRIIMAVPFTVLNEFSRKFKHKKILISAQNCYHKDMSGAFTGSVSADMIKGLGVKYVIIGHSENRNSGETNKIIEEKISSAIRNNFTIIFCIGENKKEKIKKKTIQVLKKQISSALKNKYNFKKIIIAYEPVWSIGTGKIPDINELKNNINLLKNYVKKKFRQKSAPKFLYGGSVEANNIQKFKSISELDGFLIGGASKSSKKFIDIIKNFYK
tara:strand:- start:5587 stop:6345 length:759 start_codon:yes stop_codon:yes gene_type:complete